MQDEFQVWSDAVCACVRFWPDRVGIAREQNYSPTDMTAYQTEQARFLEEAFLRLRTVVFTAGASAGGGGDGAERAGVPPGQARRHGFCR